MKFYTEYNLINYTLLIFLSCILNILCQKHVSTEKYERIQGPSGVSDREVYFNGTAYIRLQQTISLRRHISFGFRTCHGKELFKQTRDGSSFISLSVHDTRLILNVTIGEQKYVSILNAYKSLLDNRWHTVDLIFRFGNLTMYLDGLNQGISELVANETYNSEILTNPELYKEDAILIVGNSFIGCILGGPGLMFGSNVMSIHQAVFGVCPLTSDICNRSIDYPSAPLRQDIISTKQPKMAATDHCFNHPCMSQGDCISHPDRYECKCKPRYTGKNCEVDLGEPCNRKPCMNGGTCNNAGDDYSCYCLPSFTGKDCESEIEINPFCETHPCQNNGTCMVIPNTPNYHCVCVAGFTGDNCEININECLSNPCQNSGSCIDGINNYTCNCQNTGYTGVHCELDVDECDSNPCLNKGTCFNYYGTYRCQCRSGFYGKNCENVLSECSLNPCKNHGHCIDDDESYKCICPPNYTGMNCEVRISYVCNSVADCPTYADCIDVGAGIYQCVCKDGYPRNRYYNCTENQICKNNPCMNFGTCIPFGDIYQCVCLPGFTGSYCEKQLSCKDQPCLHAILCRDYVQGYYCACESGWTGQNCNIEINECLSNPCRNSGVCTNLIDAYECKCLPGFTGKNCQRELNKCTPNPCKNGGSCKETPTGFNCTCTDFWMGPTCERSYDICMAYHNPCLNNGTCIADPLNPRQFTCICMPGFTGKNCEINVDDCKPGVCPDKRVCVDGINSFECVCPSGFTGDTCSTKIDSCEVADVCNNGTCKKIGDAYECVCNEGYKGKYCDMDIDECADKSICNNGICVNRPGTFECYCKPGYTGNLCDQDFDECLSHPCKNGATCINKINNYECICTPGFESKDCGIEINECESNPCAEGAKCIDSIGSFKCICPLGLTGPLCDLNIDDCSPPPCLNNGVCIDGINSYTCNCNNTGFRGVNCEENIDDCFSNPCTNGANCTDLILDYNCSCFPGFTGKNCEIDIDECLSNPCKHSGTCLQKSNVTLYDPSFQEMLNFSLPEPFHSEFSYNNSEGYECICVEGITGKNCEIDINECDSSPCFNGQCIDHVGYYVCECDDGFEGMQCEININECLKYSPCVHGTCIDRRADYYCECQSGYGGKNCSVELKGCSQEGACLNNGTCKPYLENEIYHKFNCSCTNGFHGAICENVTTMSLEGNSYVAVNTTRDEGYDIQFRFKTTLLDGLLAIGKGVTFYILELVNGRLNLHSSLLNKWEGVFIGSNLNDSQWHKVFVAINSSHLVLSANEEQTIYPINLNEGNASHTSFPTTYLGGTIPNLRRLTHGPSSFVGCAEDVIINGEWVLPENGPSTSGGPIELENIKVGCPREPQCKPNPCHSGGACTDLWRTFNCSCIRPYIGHTCQYNYTAATFGHENITNSLVTVSVTETARRAVRYVVHISMFIRTRQNKGQIFYLGSAITAVNLMEKTYISAELEGGELLVRIQFNGTPESYTVDGVKLDTGYNTLIEISRNVTLVQVKLNGTEYFRKTISATGQLDVQTLYLGGLPQISRPVRQADINTSNQAIKNSQHRAELDFGVPNFKGIIQDVQITNGTQVMVVEFFPLQAPDLEVPMWFGEVFFEEGTILEGVVTDNMCRVNPCQNNGTCYNTWNDFNCNCEIGYKGKICDEMEFCQLQDCPEGSICRNLNNGYECIANATFDGRKPGLMYDFVDLNETKTEFDRLEINYRTNKGGTLLYAQKDQNYFIISVYRDEIFVCWKLRDVTGNQLFKNDHFDGNWTTLVFKFKDNVIKGGFKDIEMDDSPIFVDKYLDTDFVKLMTTSKVIVGGGFNNYDKDGAISGKVFNLTKTYFTTESMLVSNSIDQPYAATVTPHPQFHTEFGENFKGCIGEIRLGEYLLPYFTVEELNSSNIYSDKYFALNKNLDDIGCILCFDTDCQNGGKCLSAETSYICECSAGFDLDDCSHNIDECVNNNCRNNSTCVDDIANYTCSCNIGWEGWLCDIDINECLSDPCMNGGTCEDLLGLFNCKCPNGYSGTQCEVPPLITCNDGPCKNNSKCLDVKNEKTGNNFTCQCAPGFVGEFCNIPYCEQKKCENGNCTVIESMPPICTCIRGYKGEYCEIDIDDCILPSGESPCQHNGKCIDQIDAYICNCTGTGYKGLLCEHDIDECKQYEYEKPCGTAGECINFDGGYRCNCPTGFCGRECILRDPCYNISNQYNKDEIVDDEVGEYDYYDRCGSHGKCVETCDLEPTYRCDCFEGYEGENCTNSEGGLQDKHTSIDIAVIVIPIIVVLLLMAGGGLIALIAKARSNRATRGTYSPSAQEFCNPRVEMDHVLKPPPEERLI